MRADRTGHPLRIVPPPGPLGWLFPEILDLLPAPRPDAVARGTGAEGLLDLGRSALVGHAVRDAILERNPREICLEDGPRGHAAWAWLRQALRGRGIPLPRPDPRPPDPTRGGPRETTLPPTLESFLTACAGAAGDAPLVRVERGSGRLPEGGIPLRSAVDELARPAPPGAEGPLSLLPLTPGVGLIERLDRALERIGADPAPYRRAGLIPYFVTAPPAGDGEADDTGNGDAVETRLPLSCWGLLPGDACPVALRDRFRELIRLLHPGRNFLFLALENYALAGIDLYSEALAGRFDGSDTRDRAPAVRGGLPLILAVCGTDGSGKSSHVAALADHFSRLGLRVERRKIYRHGVFHDTVTDLTRLCAGGRNLHLWRLQRLIKVFDSVKYYCARVEPVLGSCDVLIFDRYIPTHLAASIGRYHHDPFVRELLRLLPPAERTYLLDLPARTALRRIGTRGGRTVDENPYMLARYRHALGDLAAEPGFVVLDGLRPFEENRRLVREDAVRIARSRGILP